MTEFKHVIWSNRDLDYEDWRKELEEEFLGYEIELYPLSLSVSCHIGPGALGVACVEEVTLN